MGRKLRELTIKDDFSVGVQGEIRLKPRNFGDFQRYPQSAYVQYASIVCLEKIIRNIKRVRLMCMQGMRRILATM